MLRIPTAIGVQMIEEARRHSPLECCGLLAGSGDLVGTAYPLRNRAADARRYDADPRDLIAAFRELRSSHLELLGIYHSHPSSAAIPSRVDLSENYYGDVPRLIISLVGETPCIRAFRLGPDRFEELELGFVD